MAALICLAARAGGLIGMGAAKEGAPPGLGGMYMLGAAGSEDPVSRPMTPPWGLTAFVENSSSETSSVSVSLGEGAAAAGGGAGELSLPSLIFMWDTSAMAWDSGAITRSSFVGLELVQAGTAQVASRALPHRHRPRFRKVRDMRSPGWKRTVAASKRVTWGNGLFR